MMSNKLSQGLERRIEIPLSYTTTRGLIGEEGLFNNERYLYTVTAKSAEVMLLEFSRSNVKELVINDLYTDIKDKFDTTQ